MSLPISEDTPLAPKGMLAPAGEFSALIDNARFLMMVLVIMTHSLTPVWYGHVQVLNIIHPFQTRTFCFISGVLNQDLPSREKLSEKLIERSGATVMQILVFCVLLEPLVYKLAAGEVPASVSAYLSDVVNLMFNSQERIHWYLYGLLWWRLFSYLVASWKPMVKLCVALAASACLTYTFVPMLSLTESFACLPFFVAGQAMQSKGMLEAWVARTKSLSTAAVLTMGMLCLLVVHKLSSGSGFTKHYPFSGGCVPWAMQEARYDNTGIEGIAKWLCRGLFGYAMMLSSILAFLVCLCPRSQGVMAGFGRHSIYPYLLHHSLVPVYQSMIYGFLERFDFLGSATQASVLWTAELAFCFSACAALSSKPVRDVCWMVVDPLPKTQTAH